MTQTSSKRRPGSWNLSLIEFDEGEDSRSAVHEEHFGGSLKGCSTNPAVLMWTAVDGLGAAQRRLEKFQRAPSDPAIKGAEFAT